MLSFAAVSCELRKRHRLLMGQSLTVDGVSTHFRISGGVMKSRLSIALHPVRV
jgi:hypothetical protein